MDSKNVMMVLFKQTRNALYSFVAALPKWARSNFYWSLLIIPLVFSGFVYGISEADIFGWQDFRKCKNVMEIIHPSLLALVIVISISGWLSTKEQASSFLAVLGAFALFREIFGQGTTPVFLAGIIGLIVYWDQDRERIAMLLNSRWATSFLAMCFFCYLLSQLLDRGVIKRIGWLILWDTSWKPPHSSNIEEGLESLGGLFLVITSISLFFQFLYLRNTDKDQ